MVPRAAKAFVKDKLDTTAAGALVKKGLKRTGLWSLLRPRRFHVFCVGAPRTGTMSMARLFEKNYRALHEPGQAELIRVIEAVRNETMSRQEVLRFLREHDLEYRLELEASHPMATFAESLAELFPEARFIVTVRDCYSWLDSIINKQLYDRRNTLYPAFWRALSDIYHLRPEASFPPREQPLQELGLYSLEGYLAFWTAHYQHVFDSVPEDRQLVVRTDRILGEVDRIASFAGVAPETLDTSTGHANIGKKKDFPVMERLGKEYVTERVEYYCGDMMRRFFPEKM